MIDIKTFIFDQNDEQLAMNLGSLFESLLNASGPVGPDDTQAIIYLNSNLALRAPRVRRVVWLLNLVAGADPRLEAIALRRLLSPDEMSGFAILYLLTYFPEDLQAH